MKTWVRKSLKVGILSAGFLLIGGAAANAASTADNFGVLGGNQVQAPIQAPISVTGNAIGLLGSASATSHGGASGTAGGAAAAGSTSDNFGIGSGNQAGVSLLAPVSVAGNAIGGLGSANATATGSGAGAGSAMLSPNATGTSSGNFGILGGNQVHAPVQVPISITGNSIGLLGTASAASHGANGATAGGGAGAGAAGGTSDNFGIGSGNQVIPVLLIPIEVCGNGIAVLGTGDAACGAGAGNAGYGTGTGNGGYGTGTGTGGYGTGTGNGGYGTGTGTGGYTTGTGAGTMTGATTLTNLAGGGGAANVAGARQHKAKAHAQHKATKAAKADASNESADVRSAQRMSAQSSAGTSRNFGILGGTQGDLLIQTPVNVTHDALGLLGTAAV